MNQTTKNDILTYASNRVCDIDGDIVIYNGKKYYVHLGDKIVEPLEVEK